MPISYYLSGQHIHDRQALEAHLAAVQPPWLLVLDNPAYALTLARQLPRTQVIVRSWPDDDPLARWPDAQAFADAWGRELQDAPENVWVYTNNESGISQRLVAWWLAVLRETRFKLVLGNMSVGTPEPQDWKREDVRALLRALDQERDRAVLGLHEYAHGVITSGMTTDPQDAVAPDAWPKTPGGVRGWHCGRWRFLETVCAELGIRTPRIVITEHGMDDLHDQPTWRAQLLTWNGGQPVRGWKTAERVWAQWWPQWTAEQAYAEQLIYADLFVYRPPVEAQLVFLWGAHPHWQAFDISGAARLHDLLLAHARMTPSSPDTSSASPAPPKAGVYRLTFPFQRLNVRAAPRQSGALIGSMTSGARVTVLPEPAVQADGYTWIQVYTTFGMGWIALVDGVTLTPGHRETQELYPAPKATLSSEDWRQGAALLRALADWLEMLATKDT